MNVRVALGTPHEDHLRQALLQRIATALDVTARARHYTCCWLNYAGPGGEPWIWRLCALSCDHLHHRHEVVLANPPGGAS